MNMKEQSPVSARARSPKARAWSRLPPRKGEWIDRRRDVHFQFEGKHYTGVQGDTIASALLANGQLLLGRSFKYHRPRSLLSAAGHDVNALMSSAGRTHIRADVVDVFPGEEYWPVNASPNLQYDRNQWLDKISPLLPVGFYYKAFHTPKALFPFWEKRIRRKAGLGEVDHRWPSGRKPKSYHHCDLVVVGGGASGMSAALAAADAGWQVVLIEENARLGGALSYQWCRDERATQSFAELSGRVASHSGIKVWLQSVCVGCYEDFWLPVSRADGMVKVRSRSLVVASGLWEQPAVFRNNDLPGVLLASAAQRLIYRYGVAPCSKAVILTGNDAGFEAAQDCLAVGIEVAAIVDMRAGRDSRWGMIPVYRNATVYEARGGVKGVTGVRVARWRALGEADTEHIFELSCDGVLMSVGWAPVAPVLYQANARFAYDETLHQSVPDYLPAGVFACGSVNGVWLWADRVCDGERAGTAAAAYLAGESNNSDAVHTRLRHGDALSHPYPVVAHPRGKNFVDFDEDLQLQDLQQAWREGFDNVELLKRFSTLGMGPSQGKLANANGQRILAQLNGAPIAAVGATTARPFYHPVPLNQLAGRGFRPQRRSSLHRKHEALGATFMEAGAWLRPEYYGEDKEFAVRQEMNAVRNAVGVMDVSTLGKIEVFGADAATLLDGFYTLNIARLKLGKTTYALSLDDSGVIVDDGIVARLGPNHYYVTATSAHAAETARELNRCALQWGLEATVVNLTGQRAAISLAGPYSRAVLRAFCNLDLEAEAFPYLGVRQGLVLGVDAVLLRVGFVGELGYEIHLPWRQAPRLWQTLLDYGHRYAMRPFGVEAQRRLRLEKGHLIVGQDTDGLSTPYDVGLDWAVKFNKPFFIGRHSLEIMGPQARYRMVGVRLASEFNRAPPQEACLVIEAGEIVGRLTSFAFSPQLQRYIGLALIDRQKLRDPVIVTVRTVTGDMVSLEVVRLPFYDAEGHRQNLNLNEVA